jgi:DNA-3-methyladenine glycosylase II
VQAAVKPMSAKAFLELSDDELRQAGLSRGKVRTLRATSEAVEAGLDFKQLAAAPEEVVHETLTALPGIGPWSADIFLLFCLGRADAFAAGDLALQIAAANAMQLAQRPSREELLAIAERWRPWRGVAAHMLWAYYKVAPEPSNQKKA